MKNMKIKLNNLYQEMENEVALQIKELGGRLDMFDVSTCTISISVDPSLKEFAEDLISELIQKYQSKKISLIKSDHFYGIKDLLDNG